MKKKIEFASTVNYNPSEKLRYEENSGEIVTVVGEAYTIQELFARHLNGMDPRLQRTPIFEDTEDFDMPDMSKINRMDIHDRAELYAEVEAKAKMARKQAEKALKEQDAKDKQEASERSVETRSEAPDATAPKADTAEAPVRLDNTGAK